MLTLHNLSKFDDTNIITCKARNQVESVWRETDISDVIRVGGELIKFWASIELTRRAEMGNRK